MASVPTLSHYLVLGAILFAISMAGIFLNRKNVIIILMAIELMLLAVNLNFIAFSHYLGDMAGQVFVFFILTVAAAESAISLAILLLIVPQRRLIDVEDMGKPRAERMDMQVLYLLVPVARLVGAIVVGLFGPKARRAASHWLCILGVAIAMVASYFIWGDVRAGTASTATSHVAAVGRPQDFDRFSHRPADRDDDARGDVRVADGARLYDRLHGRRPRLHALFLLYLAVHVLDADARDEQQLRPALLRLGGGRARVVPLIGFWYTRPTRSTRT
jgi:NADH-quinone oxidoreductase subunit K